jgi:hypothetical protein
MKNIFKNLLIKSLNPFLFSIFLDMCNHRLHICTKILNLDFQSKFSIFLDNIIHKTSKKQSMIAFFNFFGNI